MFLININNGTIEEPMSLNADDSLSISWFGETSFLTKLLLGFDERLFGVFEDNGVDRGTIDNIFSDCREKLQLLLGVPASLLKMQLTLLNF